MLTEKIFYLAQIGGESILWLLLILSVFSVAMILERYWTLRKIRQSSERMQLRIKESLQANDLDSVEDMAKERETIEGKALSYGVRHIQSNGTKGLEEIFNTFSLVEKPNLEKHLNFLATLGSNAPFIGLLGTVLHIMQAITTLSTNQSEMSQVIGEIGAALAATAVGLGVAIPAVIAYNYFQRQVKQTLTGLESVKELCLAYAKQRA